MTTRIVAISITTDDATGKLTSIDVAPDLANATPDQQALMTEVISATTTGSTKIGQTLGKSSQAGGVA